MTYMNMNKENLSARLDEEAEVPVSVLLPSERTDLASTTQLAPEIVEELFRHVMDPVHGMNANGRKTYWHVLSP